MPRSGARNPFRSLRETCEFWVDERPRLLCCRFADDDTLNEEPDLFDCETCAVEAQLAGMDADNKRAWDLAHLLLSRFMHDTQSMGAVLTRLSADLDDEDFADLVRRLSMIYDVLMPAPKGD